MMPMSVSLTWGTTPEERLFAFPCDRHVEDFDQAYYRGITIRASSETIFCWLCQMRVAPYSYDWIDNFGHQSPRKLIPGMSHLEIGQSIMTIFELVEFETNRQMTIRNKKKAGGSKIFGDVWVSYLIREQATSMCRLLAKVIVRYPAGPIGWMGRTLLPWGDLIMMRRQLLNFKILAECTTTGV
jgi:hypothetical protein